MPKKKTATQRNVIKASQRVIKTSSARQAAAKAAYHVTILASTAAAGKAHPLRSNNDDDCSDLPELEPRANTSDSKSDSDDEDDDNSLLQLQLCHKWIGCQRVSDIVTGDGRHIRKSVWQGLRNSVLAADAPLEGPPSAQCWKL
jgi:hypothetical protein